MKWSTTARVQALKTTMLPKMGVRWRGTDAEFVEVLLQCIDQMPEKNREAMRRFYIEGDTRQTGDTGRPVPADHRFYALLQEGRVALATLIRVFIHEKRVVKRLGDIYGS